VSPVIETEQSTSPCKDFYGEFRLGHKTPRESGPPEGLLKDRLSWGSTPLYYISDLGEIYLCWLCHFLKKNPTTTK